MLTACERGSPVCGICSWTVADTTLALAAGASTNKAASAASRRMPAQTSGHARRCAVFLATRLEDRRQPADLAVARGERSRVEAALDRGEDGRRVVLGVVDRETA